MREKIASNSRAMWLTIIALAIADYRNGKETSGYFYSEYFERVCALADVLPEDVRKTL